jgi:hypothetical protein
VVLFGTSVSDRSGDFLHGRPTTRKGFTMAGSRTGTSSIYYLAKKICRMVALYGASDLSTRVSPEFATAVTALVAACHAFEALDNLPFQVDRIAPAGPEDSLP